ncbi:MAG: HDIG domain-containing protein [Deltaproteobacteria bacterium]|nr:HDIG domain-containing protein [Deltaproteobacteria bacterium]
MNDRTKTNPSGRKKSPKRKGRGRPFTKAIIGSLKGLSEPERLKWLVFTLLSLVVSLALYPGILSRPAAYRLGDIASRDIKASEDFLIENKELTEKNREQAVKAVLAVYDFDRSSSNLVAAIREAFKAGREYASRFPPGKIRGPEPYPVQEPIPREQAENREEIFNTFFGTLGIPPEREIFDTLLEAGFPPQVEERIITLVTRVSERGIVGNWPMLKKHMEKGGIILHEIASKQERKVTDLRLFYDLEGAREYVASRMESVQESIPSPELARVTVRLTQLLLRPNLTFNQRETEVRKDESSASVHPVYFKVKKGEMLVREGERIGPEHLLKLSAEMRAKNRLDSVGRVPAMALLVGTLLLVIYLTGSREARAFRGDRRDLLFNALTLLGLFIFAWVYGFIAEEVARGFSYFSATALLFALPIAFGSMVISIFQGMAIAWAFSLVISVLVSLVTGGRVEFFIYYFISSLLAAYGVKNCKERGILIKTGLMVGLVNMVLALAIEMIYGTFYSLESIIAAASGFAGGILSGVIATGILPLVEMAFGFTSDIKLLELASLDQPLLRELMVRAPGTYHHSVITSNMVEATAKAVDANPLLAKVSAYYHDIGKMKKPLYFIENQLGGENRHEKLAPSMSSLILISHVKDGVELAKEHRLGKEIIDIIQQHHGTSLISFFYHKAKERMLTKGTKCGEIKEEDFRYPGPKPQTKEAGLVMLADMVEAASRSLVDPTPARIQGMVQKIINKVFSDGQLNECELTLKDLNEIAKSFNKTLSGIFHHRVEYPETASRAGKKTKNGYPDQVPKEDSGLKNANGKEESGEGLKRLGLS